MKYLVSPYTVDDSIPLDESFIVEVEGSENRRIADAIVEHLIEAGEFVENCNGLGFYIAELNEPQQVNLSVIIDSTLDYL